MNIYQQYHAIRHQMDTLAVQEKKLKEKIIEELVKSEDTTVKNDWGNFTRRVSKKYSFSTDLLEQSVEAEKKIKELTKPLLDKVEAVAKPLRDEIEFAKQREITSGKAKEQLVVNMSYSYKKND